MKKLILCTIITATTMLMGAQIARAESCCKHAPSRCLKKKVCTEEICRHYFCSSKCMRFRSKPVHYVEITYKTTYEDCCGKYSHRIFTKVRRTYDDEECSETCDGK